MIEISVPHWVESIYKSRGWQTDHRSQLSRRWGAKVMKSPCGGRAVVALPPVRIEPPAIGGSSPVDQLDAYLQKIRRGIEKMISGGLSVEDVFLTGGGTLPVPQWFRDWCATQGIRIHVVDPGELPQDDLQLLG